MKETSLKFQKFVNKNN